MKVECVPGRLRHAAMILPRLRSEERMEMVAFGIEGRRDIPRLVRSSLYCRALFIEGEIAALGGLVGSMLTIEPQAWLLTTATVELHPFAFLRAMLRELDRAFEGFGAISAWAPAGAARILRFWQLAGAHIGEPRKLGCAAELFREIRWGFFR